jgi:hypothetical protein
MARVSPAASCRFFEALAAMWTGHIISVNFAAAMITGQKETRAAGKTARRI